jgi:hypothetical protein
MIWSALPYSLHTSFEVFRPPPARIYACVVLPTRGQTFHPHILWITILSLCLPVSWVIPKATVHRLAGVALRPGEIPWWPRHQNNVTTTLASTCRSAHHRIPAHLATILVIHHVPTSLFQITHRTLHRQAHFQLSPCQLLHLHLAILQYPYTPSKSRSNGPSPILVTMPMCPPLGNRRTSDRATDSLYPHRLHLRPHLTLNLNLRRHLLTPHLSSNSISPHTSRLICLNRRRCQCRSLLVTDLIPAGNTENKLFLRTRRYRASRSGALHASDFCCP